MERQPTAMIVQKYDYAATKASGLNKIAPNIQFLATTSEQEAIDAFMRGDVDVIVTGINGVAWKTILEAVGPYNMIVYSASAYHSEIRDIQAADVLYLNMIPMGSQELLFAAIQSRAIRETSLPTINTK